jgi:hypothetical protein
MDSTIVHPSIISQPGFVAIVSIALFALSELIGFLPVKANGVIEVIIGVLSKILKFIKPA